MAILKRMALKVSAALLVAACQVESNAYDDNSAPKIKAAQASSPAGGSHY